MMSAFFNLSKFIVIPILTEWLEAKTLLVLYSSVNKDKKTVLSLMFTEYQILFDKVFLENELTRLNLSLCQFKLRHNFTLDSSVLLCESFLNCVSFKSRSLFQFWKSAEFSMRNDSKDITNSIAKSIVEVKFPPIQQKLLQVGLQLIANCFNLQKIESNAFNFHDALLGALADGCPNIQSCVLKGPLSSQAFDVQFKNLPKFMNNCCKVNSFTVDFPVQPLPGSVLRNLLIGSVIHWKLKELKLSCCQITSYQEWSVRVFAMHARSLTALTCDFFDDISFLWFLKGQCGAQLRYLDLHDYIDTLSDLTLSQVGVYCTQLQHLSLSNIWNGTDCITSMMPQLTQLTALHLMKNNYGRFSVTAGLDSVSMDSIVANCFLLEELSVDFWYAISSISFPRLRKLVVASVIQNIDSFINLLSSCPLEYLEVIANNEEVCTVANILEGLLAIGNICANLRSLRLDQWYVSPNVLFLQNGANLIELGVHVLQYNLIVELLNYCPNLKILYLYASVRTTESNWDEVIPLLRNLKELYLIFHAESNRDLVFLANPNILRNIVKKCRQLQLLKVIGCMWNVWNMNKLEEELKKLNPDCFISM